MSAEGIFVEPSKIKAINERETPKILTEMRSFLDLAGYWSNSKKEEV